MRLNTLSPAEGSKKAGKRLGVVSVLASVKPVVVVTKVRNLFWRWRTSRFRGWSDASVPSLPKFGFTSRKAAITAEVRLSTWLK